MDGDTTDDRLTPEEFALLSVEDDWDERYERPRGMLTDVDRQFLWGIKTYEDSPAGRSHRRSDIRQRVVNGIGDLWYLTMLEDSERDRIIEELQEDKNLNLYESVSSFIEFLYLGLGANASAVEAIEEMVEFGVLRGSEQTSAGEEFLMSDEIGEVTVTIEIERIPDVDELYEKYTENPAYHPSSQEIGILVRAGKLDADDLEELDWTKEKDRSDNPLFDGPDPR